MRPLILLVVIAVAGCDMCGKATPTDMEPQVLSGRDGKQYLVEHHMGCVFSVRVWKQ